MHQETGTGSDSGLFVFLKKGVDKYIGIRATVLMYGLGRIHGKKSLQQARQLYE